MKILHVIPAVAMRYGGPSVAIRGMAAAQAARGHEVEVVTTDADGPARLAVPLVEPVWSDGYAIRYFPRTLPGEWKYSRPLARWLDAHVAEHDVVHVHALFCHTNAAACRAAWRHDVPYVIRPLGTLGAWSLRQRRWKKAPYFLAVERGNLHRAAAVHATSSAEAAEVAAIGLGDRVHVVELGLDLPDALAGGVRRSGGPLRAIFLGRLHPKKNVPLLLEAIARARRDGADIVLDVVGDGPAEYLAELRALVQTLGVGDQVRFVGPLTGDAKWNALAGAEVFVLPSSHENFGIAVAEAMAAGCAVLVSDQVALAPEVERCAGGQVVARDPAAIAAALRALAGDRDAARAMAERARAFATARFSWARTAQELDALYASIVGRPTERVA